MRFVFLEVDSVLIFLDQSYNEKIRLSFDTKKSVCRWREKIACPFASALVFPQVEIVKVLSIIKKDLQVSTLDNGYKAVMKLGMPATSELLSGKPIAKVQMKTELFI